MMYATIATLVAGIVLEIRNAQRRTSFSFHHRVHQSRWQAVLVVVVKAAFVIGALAVALGSGQPFATIIVTLTLLYLVTSAIEHNNQVFNQLAFVVAHYKAGSAEVRAVGIYSKVVSLIIAQLLIVAVVTGLIWCFIRDTIINPIEAVSAFAGACIVVGGLGDAFLYGVHRRIYREVLNRMARQGEQQHEE
jgi:hypothetical protein